MLLTNPHRPDPRVLREAKALIEEGIEVDLVAWDREGGRSAEAVEDGIRVHRLGPRAGYRSAAGSALRLPRFWFRALRRARTLNFDIVHSNDFDTLPLGLILSKLHGKKLVYDAHDLYAKMVWAEVGECARVLWPFERWMAHRADRIITTSEGFAAALGKGMGGEPVVVTNSPDASSLTGSDPMALRAEKGLAGLVVSYFGTLEPGRFVEELVSSFEPSDGVTVVIGGSGTLREVVERAVERNHSVRYLGHVRPEEALLIESASDVIAAMQDPKIPNNQENVPIKILEAMACGRPVITADGMYASKLVRDSGCGLVVPYDRDAFRKAVLSLKESRERLADMGAAGRKYFDAHLSWERSRERLLEVYRTLLRG